MIDIQSGRWQQHGRQNLCRKLDAGTQSYEVIDDTYNIDGDEAYHEIEHPEIDGNLVSILVRIERGSGDDK